MGSSYGDGLVKLGEWIGRRLSRSSRDKSSTSSYSSYSSYTPSSSSSTHTPLQTVSFPDVYTSAKVVLVGDSGVGKSGLALVLTGQDFAATESTHGRQVWLLDQQEIQPEGGLREAHEVWLWDLAGQPDYRLIHQLHLHEATVALIVFDAARDTDPLAGIRQWHRALHQAHQVRGSTLPLTTLLVASRIDRGGVSVSRKRIDEVVQELGCTGYIETSAKDGRGITELIQTIHAAIDWTRLPRVTSTTLLHAIKAFLLNEQHTGAILRTVDDLYNAFLRSPDVPAQSNELYQQFETALGRLEAQGSIRWLDFGNLILLQPERLDAYASALLIAVKSEPDGLGSVPEELVQQGQFSIPAEHRLPNSAQERLLLIAMIDELVRHQLALREGGSLLFPSQSKRQHPNYMMLEGKQAVIFTFAGPILPIYTTLVVRLAQSDIFQKQELWQRVVTYTTGLGGSYGLRLSPHSEEWAKLGLFFDQATDEEMRFHFEAFISTHLERYAYGTVQCQRRLVCPECGKAFSEADVTYRRDHGFTFIQCVCDTEVPLLDYEQRLAALSSSGVTAMEQAVDVHRDRESSATIRQGKVIVQETSKLQLRGASKATQQIHIYISSASTSEEETLLDGLEKQLSMVKRQPDVTFWQKRLIPPGKDWAQEISAYINEAHLILFLLSPDFLASDQCYKEMELAMQRRNRGEVSVIPLLLRPTASWQDTPLGPLVPLPADREPISDRPDRESTMRDIAEHIRLAVEKIRQDLASNIST